jgi:hypothetical protein
VHTTDYLNNWVDPSKILPFTPSLQVSIEIAGVETITSNIILNHLWIQLYTAWKQGNADHHGIKTADQEYKQKAKLKPAIEALYTTVASLDYYLGRHLFSTTLEDRLNTHLREQEAWINVTMLTI